MTTIKRRLSVLASPHRDTGQPPPIELPATNQYTVLVLNANRQMANEITTRLAEDVDECSIVYAPTLELARLMLKRRKIDLIVSSPVLPDGHITRLQTTLEKLSEPPDVLIFADAEKKSIGLFEMPGYNFLSIRQVESSTDEPQVEVLPVETLEGRASSFSAEVRDALNNPLQEIVALVYVARTVPGCPTTERALSAIESAAKGMANVVWGLEERLYENVIRHESAPPLRRRLVGRHPTDYTE